MGKYLGQHFLVNKNKLRKIAEALELKANDIIVEIGPGHGELTREIVYKFISSKVSKFKIVAIEKDPVLVDKLVSLKVGKFKNNIEIIKGDALKVLPEITETSNLKLRTYKLAGNIPYYITGYLFRIIGELKKKPALIVFTLQKEVAERICSEPPKMNLLAASVQFWAEPRIIGYISKKDFRPRPLVDSAIIKLKTGDTFTCESKPKRARRTEKGKEEIYYTFIKALFRQPRKTILNNLVASSQYQVSGIKNKEEIIKILKNSGINPSDRPQDLNIEQIRHLSTLF